VLMAKDTSLDQLRQESQELRATALKLLAQASELIMKSNEIDKHIAFMNDALGTVQ
jgi:hypothetical protein